MGRSAQRIPSCLCQPVASWLTWCLFSLTQAQSHLAMTYFWQLHAKKQVHQNKFWPSCKTKSWISSSDWIACQPGTTGYSIKPNFKYSNSAHFFHTWFKLLSPWTRLTTCKRPAASSSCWPHSMQTAVHHWYETSPWFPNNHNLVSHSFGCSTHIHFAHSCPCSCFKHFCQENFTELSWWQELKVFHLLWGVSAPLASCFCAQHPVVKNFSIDKNLGAAKLIQVIWPPMPLVSLLVDLGPACGMEL